MRVNARFEGVAEKQVEYLANSTGRKVSDVLRDSVDFYYRHIRSGGSQLKHLSALIGQAESGRSDISTNVKVHLAQAFDAKYPASAQALPRGEAARPARRARPAAKRPGPAK